MGSSCEGLKRASTEIQPRMTLGDKPEIEGKKFEGEKRSAAEWDTITGSHVWNLKQDPCR